MTMKSEEAAYMFEGGDLIYLKENADGGFLYEGFQPGKLRMVAGGEITKEQINNHPSRCPWEAALKIAVDKVRDNYYGWSAKVSVNMLTHFIDSDIIKRAVSHPETLPDDDIPFLDGDGVEMFRIPNGGSIQAGIHGQSLSAKCEYVDSLHVRIAGKVYHISEIDGLFAEQNADYWPESEIFRPEAAWKLGTNRYLALQVCQDGWDYTLYDRAFHELDGGQIDDSELSILEARDQILAAHGLDNLCRSYESYTVVIHRAAAVGSEAKSARYNATINRELYNKMADEQATYKKWLLTLPPEEILNHAYEYTVREDTLLAMETNDLSDEQAHALLRSPSPLADVYADWSKRETDYMSDIWQTVEDRAETVLNRA